jgi:hypothetical protein
MTDMGDYVGYWRIKAKCLQCQLHFLLCTWKPNQHDGSTLHCPECGQHSGQFIVWREEVPGGMIFKEIPGAHSGEWEHPQPTRRRWWQFWSSN